MTAKWKVQDILERVEKDRAEVGLYLSWAQWYAMVPHQQASTTLRRLPPDMMVRVCVTAGTMYIG